MLSACPTRAERTACWAGLTLLLCLLALARPPDHDESQYVAGAVLARHGLPYRDFAYLQTPLQPLLFAPLTALLGRWTWPGLRLVNALLGVLAVAGTHRAARNAGAEPRAALLAAALFASCDIFLFSAGVARNDALPAALGAWALALALRPRRTPASALAAGLLFAAAAAAKLSWALPALGYGGWVLLDRRQRPVWVAAGALLPTLLVVVSWHAAPDAFRFEVLDFPTRAPVEYYGAERPWKLWWITRAFDVTKFLALGPALLALHARLAGARRGSGDGRPLLDLLLAAGLLAALLPAPTWRQYLLPALPPLFVGLALTWTASPPDRRLRIAAAGFALVGLTPSVLALVGAVAQGLPMGAAMREGAALARSMDRTGVAGPVATLSPQFLAATGRLPDPRFAIGPFYFRSRALLDDATEARFGLLSAARLSRAPLPAVVVGGEEEWTGGDAALDAALERAAIARGMRRVDVEGGRFRLYVPAIRRASRPAR